MLSDKFLSARFSEAKKKVTTDYYKYLKWDFTNHIFDVTYGKN